MNNLQETQVNFKVGKKQVSFKVYHNLSSARGMSIEDAVNAWSLRCKSTTPLSLCNYIMDKDISFTCLTEDQFKGLNSSK